MTSKEKQTERPKDKKKLQGVHPEIVWGPKETSYNPGPLGIPRATTL